MTPRFVIFNVMKYDCTTWYITKKLVPFLQCAKFKIEVEIMNMHLVGNIRSAC